MHSKRRFFHNGELVTAVSYKRLRVIERNPQVYNTNMNENEAIKINELILDAIDKRNLKKMILSQSTDQKIKKAVVTLAMSKDSVKLSILT